MRETLPSRETLVAWGLLASVAPDFDFAWYFLVDDSRRHHAFFTHWPSTWLVLFTGALLWRRLAPDVQAPFIAIAVTVNGLVHMVLDTVVGNIAWLAPWSDTQYALVHVPPVHRIWLLDFVVHWTFGFEVAIVLAGLALARRCYLPQLRARLSARA